MNTPKTILFDTFFSCLKGEHTHISANEKMAIAAHFGQLRSEEVDWKAGLWDFNPREFFKKGAEIIAREGDNLFVLVSMVSTAGEEQRERCFAKVLALDRELVQGVGLDKGDKLERLGLVEPVLIQYYKTVETDSVTARDRK